MNYPNIPGLDLTAHSIFCIGRNYEDHAKEMGAKPPSQPMVFLKPLSSIVYDGDSIQLPPQSKSVHHEVELVIAIGKGGKNIPEQKALQHIAGVGIGIDFTARDIQQAAKEAGHPWSVAKGFDGFAPISTFLPFESGNEFPDFDLSLSVNGQTRQSGNSSDMIFSVQQLIAYLSTIFTLSPGDLIFTGTPEGVSAVQAGDQIEAILGDHLVTLNVTITQ